MLFSKATTGHKLGVMSCADSSGGPIALRTSPLASKLPLTCEALPFAGAALPLTCPPAAANPFTARVAGYARGASLTTFGFVTIVPRYLLPQVSPSHSFAALTALVGRRVNGHGNQPMLACTGCPHAPRKGHWRAYPAAAPCRRTWQQHLAARLTYFLLCDMRKEKGRENEKTKLQFYLN